MLTRDKKLKIFERFERDVNLPKFDNVGKSNSIINGGITINSSGPILSNWAVPVDDDNRPLSDKVNTLGSTISNWFRQLFAKPKVSNKPAMPPIGEIFQKIKDNMSFLKGASAAPVVGDSIPSELYLEMTACCALIRQAKINGQVALAEQMTKKWEFILYEKVLAVCGFNKFISEDSLVEYVSMKHDGENAREFEGFNLTWIKNFTRIIPTIVSERKYKADTLKIFDNYVILHYDPQKAAIAKTKAEKDAERDPILFGVIDGSNKLYFIADWIDEYCDLTMEEVVTALKTEGEATHVDADFVIKKDEYRVLLGAIGIDLLNNYPDMEMAIKVAERWNK